MSIGKRIIDASRDRFSSVERKLAGLFNPVPPRQEFVHGLSHQIKMHPPAQGHRFTDIHLLLIVLASMFSLVTLIALGVRGILSMARKRNRSIIQR